MRRDSRRFRIIMQVVECGLAAEVFVLFLLCARKMHEGSGETLESLMIVAAAVQLILCFIRLAFQLLPWIKSRKTQYIYISYAENGRRAAIRTKKILEEYFQDRSKGKFEILTSEDIPYGASISETIDSYLKKASVFMLIVTDDYITDEQTIKEYLQSMELEKKMVPIVADSAEILHELPGGWDDIKVFSLSDADNEDEYREKIMELIREEIRKEI